MQIPVPEKRTRRRIKWDEIIAEWKSHPGQSASAFCKERGIASSSFYKKIHDPSRIGSPNTGRGPFVRCHIKATEDCDSGSAQEGAQIRITWRDAQIICVGQSMEEIACLVTKIAGGLP